MPVTFYPSGNPVEPFAKSYINSAPSAKNPLDLLRASRGTNCWMDLIGSSATATEGSVPEIIVPSAHGFLEAALTAYNAHHHLIIRPDDIWISILVQFNFYVNAHAEELRHFFVKHEAKMTLTTFDAANSGKLALEMARQIEKQVVDESFCKWIKPDFTTTTENDISVCSVIMMATLKEYFDYSDHSCCGLPAVTLLGVQCDWVQLLGKIEKLRSFGKETSLWCTLLKPVLSHFVSAFDKPDSQENKDFWNRIAHEIHRGSGGTCYSGWISAFAFFSNEGVCLYEHGKLSGLVIDGVQFHTVCNETLYAGFVEVDVRLDDQDAVMVAGLVGCKVSDSGSGKIDTLQPVARWFLFKDKLPASQTTRKC